MGTASVKILDCIEAEAGRLKAEEGKLMKSIYLGKKEWSSLVEELMDVQGIEEKERSFYRQRLAQSAILINDDVQVIQTEKDNEFRVDTKELLLN